MTEIRLGQGLKATPKLAEGDTVAAGGFVCRIAKQSDLETAAFIACARVTAPLIQADHTTGPCADCGDLLQWRSSLPKRPRKVCTDCLRVRILGDVARQQIERRARRGR